MSVFSHKNAIRQKVREFFANRSPRSDEVSLSIKNVYVFFSRQGLLFGVLLLATFVTGINYGNNLVLGLCFYLFGVWLVSVFYTFVQLSGLHFRLVELTLTEAKTQAWATIEISQKSSKPSRQVVLTFDEFDEFDEADKTHRHEPTVMASLNGRTLVRVPIYAPQRGRFVLPRLVVSSVYPLGVIRAWAYVYFKKNLLVYPQPLAFDWKNDKRATAQEGEYQSTIHTVGQSDFDMLDDYKEGESLARVSWSHVARGAGMLTKHFADPMGKQWQLDYRDMPSSHHEARLSELSHALDELHAQQVPFCLHLPSGQGQIGVGDDFIRQCRIRLACEP